jgi:hypothetical protein
MPRDTVHLSTFEFDEDASSDHLWHRPGSPRRQLSSPTPSNLHATQRPQTKGPDRRHVGPDLALHATPPEGRYCSPTTGKWPTTAREELFLVEPPCRHLHGH